jgi:hypothetical protein
MSAVATALAVPMSLLSQKSSPHQAQQLTIPEGTIYLNGGRVVKVPAATFLVSPGQTYYAYFNALTDQWELRSDNLTDSGRALLGKGGWAKGGWAKGGWAKGGWAK